MINDFNLKWFSANYGKTNNVFETDSGIACIIAV